MNDSITICFYGSSDHELDVSLANFYNNDIDIIVDSILKVNYNNIKIVTGGYGGIMNSIAEKFAKKRVSAGKNIEIIGITCDAYDFEDPSNTEKYNKSNDYSIYNNVIIQSGNFADRIQAMIELSDLFIVLPGKQGTLSELLITCESYSFGKYILNNRSTNVFIHEYWKPLLTDKSYFRKFNYSILQFFNTENIEKFILTSIVDEVPQNTRDRGRLPSLRNSWKGRMFELKSNICKVILGRLYDEIVLLERLEISNEYSILGLDFGWFHTYNNIGMDGAYYSYSSNEYLRNTRKFFKENNSIMLSEFSKDFEYSHINGLTKKNAPLKFYTGKSIPQKDLNKKDSDFSKLSDFFNTKEYGQTLIWKGFKTKLGGDIKNDNNRNESDILIFSIFLLLSHKIPKRTIDQIQQLLTDFLLEASAAKSGELFKAKDKDIISQATRAAISQVMARNTSHNIGAHVMNKLTGDLNIKLVKDHSYQSIKIDELYNDKIASWTKDRTKNALSELTHEETNTKILLDQISIFNNYVKCRMDYLADISFGTPLMQTNKYAYEDLFKRLDEVRLLLEHISGLDSFMYKIKFKRNGKEFKNNIKPNGQDDLLVAIPNDILGTQAFYNILENVIRNTAKHSDKSEVKNQEFVFTVNFIDDINEKTDYCECKKKTCRKAHKAEVENILNEFVAVEIYDNIPVKGKGRALEPDEKIEYWNKTKKDLDKFDSKIDALVFSQNRKLNEDILQDNKLRSYSLGLVEMDASAAYLRKRPVEYINHHSYDIQYDDSWSRNTELNGGKQEIRGTNCRHFLKAFKKKVEIGDDKKTEHYLGYRFFLHRPAVVLVVTENIPENKDDLKKNGIWVVSPTEFQNDLEKGKAYPHEFTVIDENVSFPKVRDADFLKHYKTSLSVRILRNITDLSGLLIKTATEIEEKCWEQWDYDKFSTNKIDIGSNINPRCKDFQVIFLDHLYSNNAEKKAISKEKWDGNLAAYHLEALSSLAQTKMPDFYRITQNKCSKEKISNDKFKCYVTELNNDDLAKRKIKEAVFSKVIVIDERVQEAAENRTFMEIQYKELYSKMNVRVPNKSINLSANSYKEDIINDIEIYIKSEIANTHSTDFILIHYSIFERMYKKEKINESLVKLTGDSKINVVFTSGRGTPDNLAEDVRFINLSSVITAFVEVRSKYVINYLLNSSRKSNKI